LQTSTLKKSCLKSFKNLKKVYSKAIFPPIYFVVGKLNSGGTSSSDGLILSIDQACISKNVDISELNTWERNNCKPFNKLQYTIAHELIHFQQNEMAASTTLLKGAILEGMADFIGELISGETSNERLKVYAKGKEKELLTLFRKEMLLDNWSNWIANSDQETEEKPADLGYWVGYQICKSYYENSKNKFNAVNEMLSIKDYEKFWNDSKIELKIW
jgi:hypothetical protein